MTSSNIITHGSKLPEDLTLVINGSRNSGKTTLLAKLIFNLDSLTVVNKRKQMYTLKTNSNFETEDFKIDYYNIIIYAKNQNQFLYQFIKHGLENQINFIHIGNLIEAYFKGKYLNNESINDEDIEDICSTYATQNSNSKSKKLITVTLTNNIKELDLRKLDRKKKNLVIFDDCSEDANQDIQTDFFQNGRHHNCSCIYLTHRLHTHNFSKIRNNCSALILFEQNQKTLEQLVRDINLPMERKEFYQFAKSAFSRTQQENKKYLYFNDDTKELYISPF